jgi:hypothetical protein
VIVVVKRKDPSVCCCFGRIGSVRSDGLSDFLQHTALSCFQSTASGGRCSDSAQRLSVLMQLEPSSPDAKGAFKP